jgi:hypothetical protein
MDKKKKQRAVVKVYSDEALCEDILCKIIKIYLDMDKNKFNKRR